MTLEDPEMLDKMIENSQKLIKRNWENGSKRGPFLKYLGKNQIRNILDMAQTTDSFKVLETFLLYQAGRSLISQEFAEDLILELEKIKKKGGIDEIRQYLGYMYRYFVWKKRLDSGDEND